MDKQQWKFAHDYVLDSDFGPVEISKLMDFIADSQLSSPKKQEAKILVVDDDALNQRLMQLLLAREGYEVDTASNGVEALEAVKRQKYDVVFMDLQMPVMDGIETSRRIRAWENGGQHTFIVALTASYLPERGQELFEAGIDNYISKPFELEHIKRLLKYSRATLPEDQSQLLDPAQKPPSEEALDVEKGIEQVGGDSTTYRELLRDFVLELPDRLRAIQQLYDRQDLVELSRVSHNLNGIAANLGASQLSEDARRLDKECVDGYTESIAHLVGEIQLTGNKLIEASNAYFADENIHARSL
jgi:CheY-like chemotaxis protein